MTMLHNRTRTLYVLWMVAAVALFLIVRPWGLYFMADDFIYISKAPELNYLYRTAFRPVSDLTLLLDYMLWGKYAGGYHVTNFGLHLLGSVLVGMLGCRLSCTTRIIDARPVGAIAATIFLVYPFVSESVFWIVGRGGSLSTLFMLVALIVLLGKKSLSGFLVTVVWLMQVLALLTYETSWLLPAIATAMLIMLKQEKSAGDKSKRIALVGLWVLLIASFVIRKIAIGHFAGSPYLNTDKFAFSPQSWLYNYATGFFRSFIHPLESSREFMLMAVVVSVLLLLAAWRYRNFIFRKSVWSWLVLSFLMALLPVALLGVSTHTSESERFLYWPSVFLCLLLAFLFAQITKPALRYSVLVLYLLGGLWGYHQSRKVYHLASQWNRSSIEALQQHPGHYDKLVAENLPLHYKGGYMFRLGFEDAVKWLVPNVLADTITIESTTDIKEPLPLHQLPTKHSIGSPRQLRIVWTNNRVQITVPAKD